MLDIFCGFGCHKVPRGGDLLVHVGILIKSTIVAFGILRVNLLKCLNFICLIYFQKSCKMKFSYFGGGRRF